MLPNPDDVDSYLAPLNLFEYIPVFRPIKSIYLAIGKSCCK